MKNSETITAKSTDESPLPRFLRGLFRGRRSAAEDTSPALAAPVSAPVSVFADREHPPKVLVVDDDPVVLKALEIKLARAGCQVVLGHDGPEAIATVRKEHPDVIVLDIGLPTDVSVTWDGFRVMQWVKRIENGEAPPIIIITGNGADGLREHALANGAVAFFQKPVDNEKLIEVIRSALKKA